RGVNYGMWSTEGNPARRARICQTDAQELGSDEVLFLLSHREMDRWNDHLNVSRAVGIHNSGPPRGRGYAKGDRAPAGVLAWNDPGGRGKELAAVETFDRNGVTLAGSKGQIVLR